MSRAPTGRRQIIAGMGVLIAAATAPAVVTAAAPSDACPFPEGSAAYHAWWRRKGLLAFGRDGLLREAARIRRGAGGTHPTADEYEALALECPA